VYASRVQIKRTFDPDSIRPDVPTIGVPPRPAGVPPEEAYTVEIIANPDGTRSLVGISGYGEILPAQQTKSFPPDGAAVVTMAPKDAAMLGLYRILDAMRWRSFDLQILAELGKTISTSREPHRLTKIHLDWPDGQQKESMPAQTALITGPDPAPFDVAGFTPRLLEETQDRFMEGTVLRYMGVQEIPLAVVVWFAHKDQRRGFASRIINALAGEPRQDIGARHVVVPEYFSRSIRYQLQDTTRPDNAEGARVNEWVLEVSILAEAPVVELVTIPGVVDGFQFDVEATVAGS